MQEATRKNQETLVECDSLVEDKQRLEQLVKSQQAMVEKQCTEIEKLLQRQDQTAADSSQLQERIADLELRVKDSADLRIVFDDACLITTQTRTITGPVPVDRSSNHLTLTQGQ